MTNTPKFIISAFFLVSHNHTHTRTHTHPRSEVMSGGQQADGWGSEKFHHSAERGGGRRSAADYRLSPSLPGWRDEGEKKLTEEGRKEEGGAQRLPVHSLERTSGHLERERRDAEASQKCEKTYKWEEEEEEREKKEEGFTYCTCDITGCLCVCPENSCRTVTPICTKKNMSAISQSLTLTFDI